MEHRTTPHHTARTARRWIVTTTLAVTTAVSAVALPTGATASAAPATRSERDGGHRRDETVSTPAATLPLGSMYHVVDQIGARDLWEDGITGKGVNVAIVDTGISPVPALMDGDKVVAAVDLSAEAAIPQATFVDTYGHGTHMAGIIAGRDPGADPAESAEHPETFLGVAPDAGIVSVKVGDNSGSADISQVIAGIDWVVDHADQLDIGVLNLSYSSGSSLPYTTDPLTFALERAWRAGIVVVVAAGNDGRDSHVLASPAIDPYVIAVSAVEASNSGRSGRLTFTVPEWMSSGDGIRNPDVSAPGAHIDSLRAPLSRVDAEHPEGYVSETLFRGSGSSQAAAVVAGAAALLLDADPTLTPDQVKALLASNTRNAQPRNPLYSGAGVIQVDDAVEAIRDDEHDDDALASVQTFPASDGSGSLEAARGPVHMVVDGEPVVGEVTVLGAPWEGTRWTGTRWTDGTWDGTRWTGGTWMGTRWTMATWTGTRWTGTRWTDVLWDGTRWTGVRWTGTRWTADEWTGSSWTGTRWTGTRWTDASWTAVEWDGTRWTGVRWTGTRWTGTRWTGTRWTGTRWTVGGWT